MTKIEKERKVIEISDFVAQNYRQFWNYSNKSNNALNPIDQIPAIVRKIIYASYLLNIKPSEERKASELIGEVVKIHPHGDTSIGESIKGVATEYKNAVEYRLLEGIGNFGSAPGDTGAAGRYISIGGSPLLSAIYKDIEFCPMISDNTGIPQPEFISSPIPIGLIGGAQTIGVGRSNYLAERNSEEIIAWIDKLRKSEFKKDYKIPAPTSVLGCKVVENDDNGFIYYYANILEGVSEKDYNRKGNYDIITALPPTKNASTVINKLKAAFPKHASLIKDASGKGEPVCIRVPKGLLDPKNFNKYGLQYARQEQILIWDDEVNTMRWSDHKTLAKKWFESRCEIVSKRLQKQQEIDQKAIRKIDLIRIFAENKMIDWKEDKVVKYFVELDAENGKEDASMVLSQTARAFLPENLEKNEITKQKLLNELKELQEELQRIGDVVIEEAYEIIKKQREFFQK